MRTSAWPHSANCAPEVQTFWPLSTQSSPSRTARVATAARSEPAAGSEKSWHASCDPSCSPGKTRALSSSLPKSRIVGAMRLMVTENSS
nr:hypothetical protein [Nocardioides alcanivorans]